ncbi:MAG: LysR family transcriptional regulator [Caldilineaceae bacterium]|nr:LysR family transcriptional regulator [Caldilineaceae bacterium]
MDLQQLSAFDRIVRDGSFSRAALSLNIAQPTISARIQALEQEVGGVLFTRSNQGVHLTALGVSFLPYARRALGAMIEGTAAVQEAQAGERGRVTIGVLGSLARVLLAPALVKFQARHATVNCFVRANDHWQLIELLYDGVVELAVITWPCVQPLTTDFRPLLHFREKAPLIVPRNHPFAARTSVTQAEIIADDLRFLPLRWWQIMPPEIAQLAARARFTVEVPSEIAIYLLAEGYAMGFVTEGYIAPELKKGTVCAVPVSDMVQLTRDSALVQLERQSVLSPAAEGLVRHIQERAAQLGILHKIHGGRV